MKSKFRPSPNHVKIVIAIIVLIFDLVGALSALMGAFYPGVVVFILLSVVSLDYIRIIRRELKLGPWYALDNIDK